MKVSEIESIQKNLKEIEHLTDKQPYNVSSYVNQRLIKIYPILTKELERLEADNVTINCPKILMYQCEANKEQAEITDFINKKLHDLVLQDYKIIDYGIEGISNGHFIIFIKYTN